MDYFDLGHSVARLRKSKGWSQQQLADYAGISRPTLSSFENGRGDIGTRKLLLILDRLDQQVRLRERSPRPILDDLRDR